MKKQTSIILSIPQTCHESWNEMTLVEKGRFCQQCQKTVTDFSALSDSQLTDLLKSKQTSACGRFTANQLNTVINAPVTEKRRKPFISIAAVVAALTITIPSVKAAAFAAKVEQPTTNRNKPTTYDVAIEGSTDFISGVVKTDGDNLPLPGASIKIKDTNIRTATDQAGQFKLRIPDDFKKKVMILEVSFVGYKKRSIKVILKNNIRPLNIRMYEDTTVLGKYAVHFNTDDEKKLSLWEKFSGAMRDMFS